MAAALPTLALETLELGFNNVAAIGVSALMQVGDEEGVFHFECLMTPTLVRL